MENKFSIWYISNDGCFMSEDIQFHPSTIFYLVDNYPWNWSEQASANLNAHQDGRRYSLALHILNR